LNLQIQKPELARRVQAQIQSGHFRDADELIEKALDALDERATAATAETATGAVVLAALEARPYPDIDLTPPRRPHIADVILEIMKDVPPEVMATMPEDGASQHDHYIYGWPKREV
jgi:hypothetical protein